MKKTYNRQFARSQWRKSFGDGQSFTFGGRQPGRDNSFRIFTGRCKK
jgi:hypothetical protein